MRFATKSPEQEKGARAFMHGLRLRLATMALIILTALIGQASPAQAQCPDASNCTQTVATTSDGRFTVAFVGVTCSNGNSTWCYDVTWNGVRQELSHITFGICDELTSDNFVGATINGVPTTAIEFGTDPTTGVFGIKFDMPGDLIPNVPKRFCFTLNRIDLTVAPLTTGLKPGPDEFLVNVCGPECPQAPTAARLNSFKATRFRDGRVSINWETGYEADNLGFNIYRDDGRSRTLITPDLVAGSAFLAAPGVTLQAGMTYSWADTLPRKARDVQYWIEDIDLKGDATMHGPFAAELSRSLPQDSFGKNSPLLSRAADFYEPQAASSSAPLEISASMSQPTARLLAAQSNLGSQSAAKISVKQAGWYRVSQAQLIAAGISASTNPKNLQLFVEGQEIPIIVRGEADGKFDASDTVEFFGVGLNSQYSAKRVYWLVAGSQAGRRINSATARGGSKGKLKGAVISTNSFAYTVERRDKIFFFSSLLNGEEDNFFGSVISSAAVDQALSLSNIDFSSPSDASIEISLQGLTLAPHQVAVWLNDQSLGVISFDNRDKGTLSLTVPHALLIEGLNTVRLARQAGSSDVSLIEFIRINYQHSFKADSDSLLLTASSGQQISISGFSTAAVQLLDVTDPDNPLQLATSVSPDQTGGFTLSASVSGIGDRKLFALADTQVRQPDAIVANSVSKLRTTSNGANLVIITRSDLLASAAQLRSYRQSRGLSVALIDVEDIYDEFSFGHKSPFAIRDFLHFTQSWKKAPRFVLLAGDGTYDPKGYQGLPDADVIPIKLVETLTMETSSDDWFVDFNNDVLADMAIGRLPAKTPQELSQMITKIITYEQKGKTSGALLVSDVHDGLFDFEAATANVESLIPSSERVEVIYRGQLGDAAAKARLIEEISLGPKVVNYVGHGTLTNWKGNILHANDAAGLGNEANPTLIVSMTCLNGLFHNTTGDSLAEALIKSGGGAVAAWASSGLTGPRSQAAMNREVVRELFTKGATTIGEATNRAKAVVADHNVRRTWILFGDPATVIR